MTDLQMTPGADLESVEAETDRIMQTGALWLAAVVTSAALLLGPSIAADWRPADLPTVLEAGWWLGAVAASLGVALLVWAGCPVMGFPLEQAHRQKVFCIRVGIVLSLSGIAFAGLMALFAPVA